MLIEFDHVIPEYLEKEKIGVSGTWNKQLSIQQGERIQVVAPSGSGKTSLIHFLYGLRCDFSGDIRFKGRSLKNRAPGELAKFRSDEASIIFQDLRLFPGHTLFENINIKRTLNPFHEAGRIEEMAAKLGIEKKLNNLARTCSYGEQQRAAIIRALQQPFDVLMMDEPFSNLDENNQLKAMELIDIEVSRRKAAVVLADLKVLDFFTVDKILYL